MWLKLYLSKENRVLSVSHSIVAALIALYSNASLQNTSPA